MSRNSMEAVAYKRTAILSSSLQMRPHSAFRSNVDHLSHHMLGSSSGAPSTYAHCCYQLHSCSHRYYNSALIQPPDWGWLVHYDGSADLHNLACADIVQCLIITKLLMILVYMMGQCGQITKSRCNQYNVYNAVDNFHRLACFTC